MQLIVEIVAVRGMTPSRCQKEMKTRQDDAYSKLKIDKREICYIIVH
jgi:hypothetical protein